jgi:hypothetical protein
MIRVFPFSFKILKISVFDNRLEVLLGAQVSNCLPIRRRRSPKSHRMFIPNCVLRFFIPGRTLAAREEMRTLPAELLDLTQGCLKMLSLVQKR